jgi:hypothetical protein
VTINPKSKELPVVSGPSFFQIQYPYTGSAGYPIHSEIRSGKSAACSCKQEHKMQRFWESGLQ